jgi:membrane protease YdiL (CAAX protease family)
VNVRAATAPQSSTRGRLVAWIAFGLVIASIAYASRFTQGKPDRNTLYHWTTAIGEFFVFAVIVTVTLAIAGSRLDLLALRQPRSWPRALGYCVLLLVGVYAVNAAIDPFLHAGREQGLTPTGWQPHHAAAFAANFVVVAGVAPFAEELLFRGLGFSLLIGRLGPWPTIVAIGIAFGLYHGLVQALPELAIFGCALAWLRWKCDSVYPGMLLHATFNSIALIAAVVS